MTKRDGALYASGMELKDAFLKELSLGHTVIPIGDCDNFDFQHGCKGHEVAE